MLRFASIILLGSTFLIASCEKCKRCSYEYDVTTIIQTVNGEEEQTTTLSGVLQGPDSLTFGEECIKSKEEFTIEQWYQAKADTTILDNFTFTCDDI